MAMCRQGSRQRPPKYPAKRSSSDAAPVADSEIDAQQDHTEKRNGLMKSISPNQHIIDWRGTRCATFRGSVFPLPDTWTFIVTARIGCHKMWSCYC